MRRIRIEIIQKGGFRDVRLYEGKKLLKIAMNKRPAEAEVVKKFWEKKYADRLKK